MAVLHAAWLDNALHVWGESSPVEQPEPGAPPDELRAAGPQQTDAGREGIVDHPFALSVQSLHALLGDLTPDGLLASIAGESTINLWLPADHGTPLRSPLATGELDAHSASQAADLAAARVPTLAFGPAEAIDLLSSLPEPCPAECDDSLRFFRRVAEHVLALLGRQQFAPTVARRGDGACTAGWRIVVQDAAELDTLQRYAEDMPPSVRAVIGPDGECPEPAAVVEDFIQASTDALIRRSLCEDPFFEQIHERAIRPGAPWEIRWLSALIGDDRYVAGAPEEHAASAQKVHAWIAQVDESGGEVPTRLCFELLEPEIVLEDFHWRESAANESEDEVPEGEPGVDELVDATGPWCLRLYLQSQDAAAEEHNIDKVWETEHRSPVILRRSPAGGREHIMAAYARAAEVLPLLDGGGTDKPPAQIELSTLEAHAFIRDYAPLLEARGFGVRLPEWARHPQRQLGLRLIIRPAGSSDGAGQVGAPARLGLSSIVDFEWRVAVGDTDMTLDDFEQLRARSAPLVRLGGRWMSFDADLARRASEYLQRHRAGRTTLLHAVRLGSGAEEAHAGLPVIGMSGTAWLEHLLRLAPERRIARLGQPPRFSGQMRPYQLRGLDWLAFMDALGIGACLADDMGLGKTIQLIALLLHERRGDEPPGPTLIFAPMSVVGNWHREIERFAPNLRTLVHHGSDRFTGDAFVDAAKKTDAIITTYALGHRDLETLRRVHWHRIVLDEAQKIKNPAAAQTIAIRSLPASRRVALTGTPLENHLTELWSIMDTLNAGLLGSAAGFRKRFAVPIERLGDRQRADQLKQMIRPFLLRRLKSDPDVECDLPAKMEMRVLCNLTTEQAALYEQIVAEMLGEADSASGIRRHGVILAALTRLKQICNHPSNFLRDNGRLDNRSGKCERLVEMLEEVLAEGDSALVFTQFREMGALLVTLLTQRLRVEVPFLHGGTPAKQRAAMINRFQDPNGGLRIFLLSLKAGGLGLNLTAANHVFHFDRWWNPAVEDQATDRAHRVGQTRRVQVHKFVCIGTIEDRIDRMLAEKVALADNIVGRGDEWLTGLSTEELRRYVELSREAIGEE